MTQTNEQNAQSFPRLEIPLNQSKVIFLVIQDFVLFLAFMALIFIATWLPLLLKILLLAGSIAGALLTLFTIIQMLKKLLFHRAGALVIGQTGFEDQATLIPSGMVHWDAVQDFELNQAGKAPIIKTALQDPQSQIDNQPLIRRLWMQWNYKKHGTPVVLHPGILQVQPEKLLELLKKSGESGIETIKK